MRKTQLITTQPQNSSREIILPAYKAPISPGPPLSHTTPANSANRLNPQESDCPESENVRRITYEFISKLCKTNPISKTPKISANPVSTKDYANEGHFRTDENEPKRTQTNPKRTQFFARQGPPKPKRTQTNPICRGGAMAKTERTQFRKQTNPAAHPAPPPRPSGDRFNCQIGTSRNPLQDDKSLPIKDLEVWPFWAQVLHILSSRYSTLLTFYLWGRRL